MACLGISLSSWLSWLKRFVPIPSPDQSTNSSRNTSSAQGSGPRGSCESSVNWRTGYVSGIVDLPCPDPAHLPKSATNEDKHHNWQPFSYNPTRPKREPPTLYSPTLGIKRFLQYQGVGYSLYSPTCLWLSVEYHSSSTGLVGILPSSFNTDVSLQKKLKGLVQDDWKCLGEKYGFVLNHIL